MTGEVVKFDVLEKELVPFAGGLDVESKRNREIRDELQVSGISNWMDT